MDDPLVVFLDDMPMGALSDLINGLNALHDAGSQVEAYHLTPRFAVLPGHPLRMSLDYRLPMAKPMGPVVPDWPINIAPSTLAGAPTPAAILEPCDEAYDLGRAEGNFILDAAGGKVPAWAVTPDPRHERAFDAANAQTIAALDLACETVQDAQPAPTAPNPDMEDMLDDVMRKVRLDGKPEAERAPEPMQQPDVEAAVAAAVTKVVGHDPAPYVPRPTADTPQRTNPAAWSEQEDADLIGLVSQAMVLSGMRKMAAIAFAAEKLGRPLEGTKFRVGTKLAERLAAAIAALEAKSSAAPQTPKDAVESGGGVAAAPAAPNSADLSPADLSPIEAHLLSLPRKGGWTMEIDAQLIDLACAGWQFHEIAAELQMDGGAVKARFDLLTKLDLDTKSRVYTRSALRDALEPWVAKPATTAAE